MTQIHWGSSSGENEYTQWTWLTQGQYLWRYSAVSLCTNIDKKSVKPAEHNLDIWPGILIIHSETSSLKFLNVWSYLRWTDDCCWLWTRLFPAALWVFSALSARIPASATCSQFISASHEQPPTGSKIRKRGSRASRSFVQNYEEVSAFWWIVSELREKKKTPNKFSGRFDFTFTEFH